ncbi:50S ribosomal protein L25 [Lysinibacillus yapensis]|uniref:Large ribosomal subunit protein bL25 n=1 Tax=Ureibacillus yapensis TaxID=2304605 RepID=A0A396S376_9BACL|nr:50S ribosomal protein L25 [Lysinibacillus yapensis]RHW32388.1 50S ribosomal protein L25 [Lysinibacillus yapensis]
MNTLVAEERKDLNRSALKKLRKSGEIPAVVYGSDIDTKSISIKNADFLKVMKGVGRNGIISLNLDGEAKDVMLRDYQNTSITKDILHVDFLQVDQHTEIDAKVSVVLKGTSNGEKVGGVAKQTLHELDVTAKASDLPDYIEIDITDFEIGHSVRVADIKQEYSNCTFKHDDDEAIVIIDYVKVVEEEEDTTEVEA